VKVHVYSDAAVQPPHSKKQADLTAWHGDVLRGSVATCVVTVVHPPQPSARGRRSRDAKKEKAPMLGSGPSEGNTHPWRMHRLR
jgi:hypothetical protein